jgi:hypothetical protein
MYCRIVFPGATTIGPKSRQLGFSSIPAATVTCPTETFLFLVASLFWKLIVFAGDAL